MRAKSKSAESLIEQELPKLLKKKPEFRYKIYDIIAEHFPPREEFREWLEKSDARFEAIDRRFEEMLNELRVFREETNKRFEAMDKRFEAMDKRFEAMVREIGDLRYSIDTTLVAVGSLGVRAGIGFERAVANVLGKLIPGIRFSGKKSIVDEDGEIVPKGKEVSIDVYVSDETTLLVETKFKVAEEDVHRFLQKSRLFEKSLKIKPRKIMIGIEVDDDACRYAEDLGIEIIKG